MHLQASDMASLRFLRLQSHFINSSKFLILSYNYKTNPKISRHFQTPANNPRWIHSITRNPSLPDTEPEESPPNSQSVDSNPRVWSVFDSNSISQKLGQQEGGRGQGEGENRVSNARSFTRGFGGKKGKTKEYWVCSECGHSEAKWWGTCTACKQYGTLKPYTVSENAKGGGKVRGVEVSEKAMRAWIPENKGGDGGGVGEPVRLVDVSRSNDQEWRIKL